MQKIKMNVEKDYILRLIQTLLDAIKRIIHGIDKGDVEQAEVEINKAYEQLGKSATFFHKTSFEELINYLKSKDEHHLEKVDLLAQLMFLNSKIEVSQKRKYAVLEKAKKLWEYHGEHSKEYSFEREQNIAHIKGILENAFPAKKLQ